MGHPIWQMASSRCLVAGEMFEVLTWAHVWSVELCDQLGDALQALIHARQAVECADGKALGGCSAICGEVPHY